MRFLGVPQLYWGRQRGPSRQSPLRLAPTRVRANEACSATYASRLLRWCGGRVFTKIWMPPRRCLLSWPGGRTSPRKCLPSWLGWQLYGNGGGVLASAGLAATPLMSSARSCHGIAVVPDKDLAGGLVDFLGEDLAEDRCLLVLI